jgi:hypothetical protein
MVIHRRSECSVDHLIRTGAREDASISESRPVRQCGLVYRIADAAKSVIAVADANGAVYQRASRTLVRPTATLNHEFGSYLTAG